MSPFTLDAEHRSALLSDLRRMIDEYHWRWGVVTSIINWRYGTSYAPAALRRLYERAK